VTHLQPRDLAFMVAMNLVWGFNVIACKVGVVHFPPLLFTVLRFGCLGLMLLPFLRWKRGVMQRLLVAAVLSGGLQYALWFLGLGMVEHVGSAAIATQLGVPFTTLMSILFLGEVIHWRRGLGITLAFAGVAVIAFQPGGFGNRTGIALVIASTLAGSLGLVAVKSLGESLEPLELQAWFAWSALPLLAFLSLMLEHGQWQAVATAGLRDWGALAFATIPASLIAHTAYYWMVRRYPVTTIAPLTLLSPVFSVAFGVLLLGDALSTRVVLGGLMTLGGVLIIALRQRGLSAPLAPDNAPRTQ
jgi:O-acetylserine/cysteine efflux transporter